MSDHLRLLKRFLKTYEKWVGENPQLVGDIETTVRWVSYFVAGRMSNSSIVTELVYSMSNIFVLLNDRITEKHLNLYPPVKKGYNLKLFLTVLEYCEVFIEVSARKLYGEWGRWFFIAAVQFFKCVARFLLVIRHKEEVVRVPAIPALDRKKTIAQAKRGTPQITELPNEKTLNGTFTFTLKRSGRVVRKVEGAPPVHLRNWIPLSDELAALTTLGSISPLNNAERLYIMKPILHLCAIRMFGFKTWKSYCTALLIDIASIRMYYNHRHAMTRTQKLELSRRCVRLLLYLLRSPTYEKYSERKIVGFINFISRTIPFTKAFCQPLIQYVPHWQDTYFYLWSS